MSSSFLLQNVLKYNRVLRLGRRIDIVRSKSGDQSSKNTTDLCSSTILIQDGTDVRELPVIVKRVKNIATALNNVFPSETANQPRLSTKHTVRENDVHQIINKEFGRCSTVDDVFTLLSKCSTVTPNIALGAVERISDLTEDLGGVNHHQPDVLNKLFEIIVRNEDVYGLLRALKSINGDERHSNAVCDEILERVAEGKLSVHQLCDVIAFFGANRHVEKYAESLEKLWMGFVERDREFDEDAIVKCVSILHHLNDSRRVVLGVLEKRIVALWWRMKPNTVVDILNAMVRNKITASKTFPVLGRWMNTNIHALTEDFLLQMVARFTDLRYVDMQIERAIERYVKMKGLNVASHPLMVAIMNYFVHFKIRNLHILNGCTEYFIVNGKKMNPMFVKSFVYPLGYLNFQPNNSVKFWKELEEVLEMKVSKIGVEDLIDIMLSCVYLQKYPLNFIQSIFNPHVLEKINSDPGQTVLKSKLKLLDTSLTLESRAYSGPLLPKDTSSKSYWYDNRIKRIVNNIRDTFESVAGGADCMSTSILVPGVFASDLYIVDVMLHPKGLRNSLLHSNTKKDKNINVAMLINLPEHYTSNGETLLGEQEMRVRHLRIMGLKVVNLKYEVLSRLKMHRKELEKYIVSKMKSVQDAI